MSDLSFKLLNLASSLWPHASMGALATVRRTTLAKKWLCPLQATPNGVKTRGARVAHRNVRFLRSLIALSRGRKNQKGCPMVWLWEELACQSL